MKRIIIGFIVIVAIGVGAILFLQYKEDKNYKKRGEFLISKIEEYHKQNYIIYFNIGFDNTKIYYSETKEWREKP